MLGGGRRGEDADTRVRVNNAYTITKQNNNNNNISSSSAVTGKYRLSKHYTTFINTQGSLTCWTRPLQTRITLYPPATAAAPDAQTCALCTGWSGGGGRCVFGDSASTGNVTEVHDNIVTAVPGGTCASHIDASRWFLFIIYFFFQIRSRSNLTGRARRLVCLRVSRRVGRAAEQK